MKSKRTARAARESLTSIARASVDIDVVSTNRTAQSRGNERVATKTEDPTARTVTALKSIVEGVVELSWVYGAI